MTINFVTGDLFECPAEALVNPVNCVGVMGKGLAQAFKQRYRGNYVDYLAACLDRQIKVGTVFITRNMVMPGPRYIINFPTKAHWSNPSKIEYIQEGLDSMVEMIETMKIGSVAVPALGCGEGKLKWEEVEPLLIDKLKPLHEVSVTIYKPYG